MLVSLIFFCGIYYDTSVNLSATNALQYLKLSNEKKAADINAFFNEISGDLKILAKNEFVLLEPKAGSREYESTLKLFRNFSDANPSVKDYYAGFSDGIIIVNDFVQPEDFDPRKRGWYIDALQHTGRVYWGEPYKGIKDNETLLPGSLTLAETEEGASGVVAVDCTLASLTSMIKNTNNFSSSYSFIINSNGTVLLHPDNEMVGVNISSHPIFKGLQSNSGHFAYEIDGSEIMAHFTEIKSTEWFLFSVVSSNEIFSPIIKTTMRWMGLILLFNIIVSVFFSIFLGRKVALPLSRINEAVGVLIDGNLTHQIGIKSHNEIGELSARIDTFTDILRNIILNMKTVSGSNIKVKDSLLEKAETSFDAGKKIEIYIDEGRSRIKNLRSSVTTSRETNNKLSSNISSLDDQVNIQATAVEQSSAAVEEMVASLKNVADIAARKQETTKLLIDVAAEGSAKLSETGHVFKTGVADRISDITSMLQIIDDMAEMTNLLSMNAAIEAAHAGEAGKGFAVVADEIRKMAETSADNSKSINLIIKEIIKSIEQTQSSSNLTELAFARIEKEILEFSEALMEISASTHELSAGGEQVLEAVSTLNNVSSDVRENSRDISDIQQQLNVQIDRINLLSTDVSDNITGIQSKTGEIVSAIIKLNEITGELGKTADSIDNDVNKFET